MKKGYAKVSLATVALLVLAAGGTLLLLSMLEEHFIYFPSHVVETTPDAVGLPYEDVRLTSTDGETIAGWFVPAPDPPATVLLLHGNAGNISHRLINLALLHDAGFAVLIIDYRGYGESTGTPSEQGLHSDARAAWDHLTSARGIPPERIVLYGESIGSAPVLHLASGLIESGAEGPGAIAVEGAFTSVPEMAQRVFPFLPVRWVARTRMDNLAAVRRIETPILFIHGGSDEIVPIAMGRRLFAESISPRKEFLEVPGATHNSVWARGGKAVATRLREFVERSLRAD